MKPGEKVRRIGHNGKGVVTVYTRLVDIGMNHIEWGVSFCSPKNSYSKQLGLMLSKRSADNVILYTPNTPLGRLIDVLVLVDILQTVDSIPSWAELLIDEDLDRGVLLSAEEVRLAFNT